ncbi:MAG: hypothetical protein ACOYNO_03575 [Saprospiraceae bacterium]
MLPDRIPKEKGSTQRLAHGFNRKRPFARKAEPFTPKSPYLCRPKRHQLMESPSQTITGHRYLSGKTARLLSALLAGVLMLGWVLVYMLPAPPAQDRVNMEKSSGRNGKHANRKARESAEEQYNKVKEAWQQIKSKPRKSSEDKKLQQELERQVKHWERKKGWKGENHSQKNKGN